MPVLHAALEADGLFLWLEPPSDLSPARLRGRRGRSIPLPPSARRNPLALPAQDLIQGLPPSVRVPSPESQGTSVLWLPSSGPRAPCPIPGASVPGTGEAGEPASLTLTPWLTEGLFLSLRESLPLLAMTVEPRRTLLGHDLRIGADLRWISYLLHPARTVIGRQSLLPAVVLDAVPSSGRGGPSSRMTVRAVWQPVWNDAEAGVLGELARAMPGSVRALGDADAPFATAPLLLTRTLAADLVDTMVRIVPEGEDRTDAAGEATRTLPASTRPRQRGRPPGRRDALGLTVGTTVDDAFLQALAAPVDGHLALAPEEAVALEARFRSWRAPLARTGEGPVRVTIRLEEPSAPPATHPNEDGEDGGPRSRRDLRLATAEESEDPAWRLTYLLSAADDPSLQVPAEDLWQGRSPVGSFLDRRLVHWQETLLGVLGTAAALSPPVARSLHQAHPSGADLSTEEAHAFLVETASALGDLGIRVLVPAWWQGRGGPGRGLRVRAQARTVSVSEGRFGLESLVSVDWQVALGETDLTPEELEALARVKAPIVSLRGQWIEVDPAQVQAFLRARRNRAERGFTVRDLMALSLGQAVGPGDLPVETIDAVGPIADFLAGLTRHERLDEEPLPRLFTGSLRPYQARGYAWLAFLARYGLGALLADDMGLGKTVQTLCLIARRQEEDPSRPVLLAAPTSLIGNWRREAERFVPGLPVTLHHGPTRLHPSALKRHLDADGRGSLVLTSYGVLAKDAKELSGIPFAGIVIDEAQWVKNPHTRAARALRMLKADYRVALTGTPVENHVGDLWSIMDFLNPGHLGTETGFRERFLRPIAANPTGPASERLRRLTGPFLLRRVKSDPTIAPDLPAKLEMKVACTLTKEQASLYRAVVRELEAALAERSDPTSIQRQGLVLSSLMRLKQILNHPAHFLGDGSTMAGRSGKLARLESMLGEALESGEKALVFTQFARFAERLSGHLADVFGREILCLTGTTPREERDRIVARFQDPEADGPPVLVLTLKAGGVGLNLTRAQHVFHYDRWWNPAVENQATDRAYRIGQTQTVEVHKFLCLGTLEEHIDAVLENKRAMAEEVVGTGEGWLSTLDTETLRDLIRLDPRAVTD